MPDWRSAEAPFLSGHTQLTFPDKFVRAGEAYFDHQSPPRWVVFQAIPTPRDGGAPDTNYAMYVARLVYNTEGDIAAIEEPLLISRNGSANTCGWFHPTNPGVVLFGSTLEPPKESAPAGYSRDRSRYQWQFPSEMRVVSGLVGPIFADHAEAEARRRAAEARAQGQPIVAVASADQASVEPISASLFTPPNGPGYAAECSWSPSARHVLYTYRDPKTSNPDLWVFDSTLNTHTPLVTAKGYNGGGFFTPDGSAIIYRSDRRGDNNLQLYIAPLAFDASDKGRVMGIAREFALTDNEFVNWAPFAHPSGQYLIYASSAEGHANYEVWAMALPGAEQLNQDPGPDWPAVRAKLRAGRVTHAAGFDGLPVFSQDGRWMMWTSQRGPKLEREQRPSSQLWVAKVAGDPRWSAK